MNKNSEIIIIGDSGRIYRADYEQIRLGITSKIRIGKDIYRHIVLLDFDKYKLNDLVKHLKRVRLSERLPNIYIFRTSKNHYSAMSFCVITWLKYKNLLFKTDVDPYFRYYTIKTRCGTLRITPKKEKQNSNLKLVCVIQSSDNYREDAKLRDGIFKLIGIENKAKTWLS